MAPGEPPDTTTFCRKNPLAQIFRAKFRDLLKKANLFDQVPPDLWQKDWVVDIIAVGSGEAVLKYLAPYVFRVAISNRNILALKDSRVTFRYHNAKTKAIETATLSAEQFIRRFLHHVLPRSFQKVRTYGLLHPKQRDSLVRVKELLHQTSLGDAESGSPSAQHLSDRHTAFLCPSCACEMIHICQIFRKRGPP